MTTTVQLICAPTLWESHGEFIKQALEQRNYTVHSSSLTSKIVNLNNCDVIMVLETSLSISLTYYLDLIDFSFIDRFIVVTTQEATYENPKVPQIITLLDYDEFAEKFDSLFPVQSPPLLIFEEISDKAHTDDFPLIPIDQTDKLQDQQIQKLAADHKDMNKKVQNVLYSLLIVIIFPIVLAFLDIIPQEMFSSWVCKIVIIRDYWSCLIVEGIKNNEYIVERHRIDIEHFFEPSTIIEVWLDTEPEPRTIDSFSDNNQAVYFDPIAAGLSPGSYDISIWVTQRDVEPREFRRYTIQFQPSSTLVPPSATPITPTPTSVPPTPTPITPSLTLVSPSPTPTPVSPSPPPVLPSPTPIPPTPTPTPTTETPTLVPLSPTLVPPSPTPIPPSQTPIPPSPTPTPTPLPPSPTPSDCDILDVAEPIGVWDFRDEVEIEEAIRNNTYLQNRLGFNPPINLTQVQLNQLGARIRACGMQHNST